MVVTTGRVIIYLGSVNREAHNIVWWCEQIGSKCSVAVSIGRLIL